MTECDCDLCKEVMIEDLAAALDWQFDRLIQWLGDQEPDDCPLPNGYDDALSLVNEWADGLEEQS